MVMLVNIDSSAAAMSQALQEARRTDAELLGLRSTIQDLMSDVRKIDERQVSRTNSRKLAPRLQPLVRFIERYAAAIDVGVQGSRNAAAIVWGLLRAALKVTSAFSTYFEALVTKLADIGDMLSFCDHYEHLLFHDERFKQALKPMYLEIIHFLNAARAIFSKPGR